MKFLIICSLSLIPWQVRDVPTSLGHLAINPSFSMDSADFGTFAQQMFDLGLVFDIKFTEDELQRLPSWSTFDKKITDGILSLPAGIELPPRPPKLSNSVNSTLWTFVNCPLQTVRGKYGRKVLNLVLPMATPTTKWTLDLLTEDFSVENPISRPDNTPMPQRLIVIGV
jgi:hypothetical protein